jgi:hypothetical protein
MTRIVGLALVLLTLLGCMPMGGPGSAMSDPVPMPALLRAPNPLIGITQSYSQHEQIDSIRTMYREQIKQMGRVTAQNRDDLDNLVRRELVDLREVLTPDQQVIFDRHVAAALRPPAPPASDLDH